MTSVGPGSTTLYEVTAALSENLLSHTKYVANLTLWSQFLIWRYTLGSGAVNFTLIGIAKDEQKIYWTYNFFRSFRYNHTYIDGRFIKYASFFREPKSYLSLGRAQLSSPNKITIAQDVIKNVIEQLQRIILSAPVITRAFDVWKVSSKYPGLPDTLEHEVEIVNQQPFNSTTYNPQFNFAPFIAPDATCCLHRITIPKGSHVLLIPSEYHSYPHELECLLPFSSKFLVKEIIEHEGFDYIPKENQKFIMVQNPDDLHIGTVYIVDPTSDNRTLSKTLKYYISDLKT